MAVRRILAEVTGARLTAAACGTDGCSIPTWAMPLSDMAAGFARFATGQGMPPERAAACVRIRQAVGSHPFMVAGTGRFCTTVMEATGPAIFVKTGAEGVFCAAFPDRGLGLALKIDDGSSRASEALMAAAALALADPADAARAALERLAAVRLRNWSGQEVGEIRVSAQAMQRLRTCL
jgi:L-asparaginase II